MRFTLLLSVFIHSLFVSGQIGTPDLSFNPVDDQIFGDQSGANQYVAALKIQSDGNIVIGGDFTVYNGSTANYIERLLPSGAKDITFDSGTGFDSWVSDLNILSNGKIVVVGNFTSYNGTNVGRVAILNTDGSLDISFNAGTGADGVVRAVEISQSGQLYLGGDFTDFNGTPATGIVRVNADGTVDNTFQSQYNIGSSLLGLKEQNNGALIAYGFFNNVGGSGLNSVVRLTNTGSLDISFDTGIETNQSVNSVSEDPSGNLYIGGSFENIAGFSGLEKLVRCSSSGVIDPTFDLWTPLPSSGAVEGVIEIGGELFVAGTGFGLEKRDLTGGTISSPGVGPNNLYAMDYDGTNLYVAGADGVSKIALPNVEESFFNIGNGLNGVGTKAEVLPNGKILVCGYLNAFNSISLENNTIIRLMPDGTLDPTFVFDMNYDGYASNLLHDFEVQADGKILTDARMTIGGESRRIIRLFPDGNVDSSFLLDPSIFVNPNQYAHSFYLQPDGKLVFAVTLGNGNSAENEIYRVLSDGSLDPTFQSWLNNGTLDGNGWISTIVGLPDGRLYTGPVNGDMYSLMPDGSENIDFSNTSFLFQEMRDIIVDPFGKLIVAGQVYPSMSSIVRIDPDLNAIDATYDTQWYNTKPVESMAIQPDGKLLVMKVVDFNQYETQVRRFNVNGTSDPSFSFYAQNAPATSDNAQFITTDWNNQIILVGGFNNLNTGFMKNGISRILNDSITDPCQFFEIEISMDQELNCSQNGIVTVDPYFSSGPFNFVWDSVTPLQTTNVSTGGVHFVEVTDANGCVLTAGTYIPGPSVSGNNFDLKTNVIAGDFRPGFDAHIWLDALNDACTSVSGEVKLILDTGVTYVNASPSPLVSGDTLTWYFNDLTYDSTSITPMIQVNVPATAQIGDTVCFGSIITPILGDADTGNNSKEYCFPIINGYDPNDKQVWPAGKCDEKYIANDQVLTYKIRFQNTGNASAINVRVEDSLEANLDLSTFRIVGSSHPVVSDIQPNGVVNFLFDNINLIDSMTNEPESHGYVIFEIQPVPNLPQGTLISNQVEIFFDFNPPIITNFVENTIFKGDLEDYDCNPSSDGLNEIVVYPNPFDGNIKLSKAPADANVRLCNMVGNVLVKGSTDPDGNWAINTSNLPNGIYFVQVDSNNERKTIRAVKL